MAKRHPSSNALLHRLRSFYPINHGPLSAADARHVIELVRRLDNALLLGAPLPTAWSYREDGSRRS